MTRQATIPIGVWLPATVAAVVWLLLLGEWGRPTAIEPMPRRLASADPLPAANAANSANAATALADPPTIETPSATPPEVPAEAPIESPVGPPVGSPQVPLPEPVAKAVADEAREAPETIARDASGVAGEVDSIAALPPGWVRLTDPAPATVRSDGSTLASVREQWAAVLDRDVALYGFSGAALAPWVVVAPLAQLPSAEALAAARRRCEISLLVPLRESIDRVAWQVAVQADGDPSVLRRRAPAGATIVASEEPLASLVAALTVASLAPDDAHAPEWWRAGVAAWIAAADDATALAAGRADASLAPLFAPPPAPASQERAAFDALAGSFAAWCLTAADAHVRASFLETARLRGGAEPPEELAARFGCTQWNELETRWRSARRR
ncbi:MAG: hypothetical protein EXS13_00095 [Planctomycetes bacterium]|nr:hypothetical protein [Planctomycetota bacterium]